ncbi:hypothetical protein FB446DRAFT_529653 [Lentinula raphanica]|nr:hypothetical protein FB446DRAFT_529653 [Lentinula raphanica]
MILVHKQQFPLSSPHAHHRRHPSAPPAVIVQPTKVPGLLSLAKPPQRQQPQHSRQRPSPKAKQPQSNRLSKTALDAEATSTLKPSPEISAKKPANANPRGRPNSKPQEKQTARSTSHSAVRGRRNNARQQSPPLPTSQAEVPSSPSYQSNNSNPFDPFLDASDARSKLSRPTSIPTLASRPSGKLARRRQPNMPPAANAFPKAIPVPRNSKPSHSTLSRSEPHVSNVRNFKARSLQLTDGFPICDDMTDTEDDSGDDSTPPATPTRLRSARFNMSIGDGPRTAPITAPSSAFPFYVSPSPSPAGKKTGKKHARVPSEGVFAMSSDEEATASRASDKHDIDLKALLGLTVQRAPLSEESEQEREAAAAAAAAAYFASSNFQNSPSPEELPPPSFAFA